MQLIKVFLKKQDLFMQRNVKEWWMLINVEFNFGVKLLLLKRNLVKNDIYKI